MFLARSASLRPTPTFDGAPTVSEVSATRCTPKSARLPSSTGLTAYPTLARFRLVNSSVSTMIAPPRGRSAQVRLEGGRVHRDQNVGASPGVTMEWSAKCSWNADTPASVPAGARISAGKSGKVARLLPNAAVSAVNRSP